MNQTRSKNSLIRGSHVMGLFRLTYIMFWFIPQSHYSMLFSVHFLFQIMSLRYLQGLHKPICDFQIKQIYQKSHLHLGRKTLDIVAASTYSTYDVDTTQNSILQIPLFHTPASHYSRNGHDTIDKIAKQKIVMTDSFYIYSGSFFPISCLKY